MRILLLSACALLAVSSLAHASPEQELRQILHDASQSVNPSVSFLQGVASLGDADLDAADVAAAIDGAVVHPLLRPILGDVERIQISGDTVRFGFRGKLKIDLAGKGWAHLKREVSFRVNGNTLEDFKGFKLSKGKKSLFKATPSSMRFGEEGGVPTVWVRVAGATKKIPLALETAELQGLAAGVRFG